MLEAPGNEGGLYRSDDRGVSWTLVSSDQRLRARPFYFNYVHVNPKREQEVWVSELRLHKSEDGGKTWTAIETPHGDNQALWFNPDNPGIMVQGNDGGANVTLNGGKSWSSIMNQADRRVLHGRHRSAVPVSHLRPAAGQQHRRDQQPAAVAWPSDEPTQTWSPGVGLRERTDSSAAGRQDHLRRLYRASSAATPSRPARSSTTGSTRSSAPG